MKTIYITVFLIAFISLAQSQSIKEINTKELAALTNVKKNTIINFWATWCVPCIRELPHFGKASREYKDVQFLFVLLDTPDKQAKAERILKPHNIQGQFYMVDIDENSDFNAWISTVSDKWSGAIPFSLFISPPKTRKAFVGSFSEEHLTRSIENFFKK